MKRTVKYPRFHQMICSEVFLITIAEGDGSKDNPVHEVTYVAKRRGDDGDGFEVIGELYD